MDSTQVVVNAAVKLAEELGSTAIIISGEANFEKPDTAIPVYFASSKQKNIIDHLVSSNKTKEEKTKEILDKIGQQASRKIERVESVSALEFIMKEIDGGTVVGIVESKNSYAIIVHNLEDNEIVKKMKKCEERVSADILRAILKISFDIANAGREGKQIGTAFIVGDVEEVMMRSHQMILNPYAGHEDSDRDLKDKKNWESVKEFAQLDGVFVVSEEGMVEAAGRYLDVDARDIEVEKGLGGRHVSAAAITRDTVSIAITVSQSGGVIHIYMDGKELMYIESTERAERIH
ncbi:DNA integrity scanning protein DisA nucleotide-binding domain protein [Methanolobus bombayensis]|uniref:DNA integrity scanning protein DisA nucleotide-binding domain protein n=1 Tax=Methanolobus bombayensis TaxID=38023 RepID=UPI001AE7C23E|nr:diadenylate cyclase [Methanolobus bombayensis]MBP1909848.1 DNA integrity scanning protein DisA with diadenylate cyclase activity [Methanolobus bombayensis]